MSDVPLIQSQPSAACPAQGSSGSSGPSAAPTEGALRMCVLTLGGELFAINLHHVSEVFEVESVTAVPSMPKSERLMIMSDLEVDRARHQATVDRVVSYSELERRAKSLGEKGPGTIDVIHLVLQDAGVHDVLVPPTFPFLHAQRLQELGYRLRTKREPFYERRVVKSDEEVRHIEAAQRATETAVAAAHQSFAALRFARMCCGSTERS